MPSAPDPEPPPEATVVVDKTGAVVAGDVTYLVTVENPTTVTATDVTLVETLPSELTWTLPPECAAAGGNVAICDLGDIAGGDSVDAPVHRDPGRGSVRDVRQPGGGLHRRQGCCRRRPMLRSSRCRARRSPTSRPS